MVERKSVVLMAGCLLALLLVAGCTSSQVDSIAISPATQSLTVGQTAQFTATGTTSHGSNHPSSSSNVTDSVTWTSSAPAVATISASGVATAVSAGSTTITATMAGYTGQIANTATLTVTGSGGSNGPGNADITTITVIPNAQSVASPGQTSQFIAIGATAAGATEDLSNSVTWSSSSSAIATITSSGLATAVSQGTSTITALYTNSDKSIATGTGTFTIVGGASEEVTALTVYPSNQALTQAQQTQFFVIGVQGSGLQVDETAGVTWTSSDLNVATIGTTGNGTPGLATAVGAGTTTITATFTNTDKSVVVNTATLTVTIGAAQEPLLSINVVPASAQVTNKGMTTQFLAFGTYSSTPTVREITNSVTWISTFPEVAQIDSCGAAPSGPGVGICPGGGTGPVGPSGGEPGEYAGLATSLGYEGDSVIYAVDYTSNPDGTVVLSNPITFTCEVPGTNPPICDQTPAVPETFSTVTVYIAGEQTAPSGEFVTAPSDTGTPDLIHCGRESTIAGGQVCTGTYEVGSTVTLTENLASQSTYFGGWSAGAGCVDPTSGDPLTSQQLATSTTCTIVLKGDSSVGVIFY